MKIDPTCKYTEDHRLRRVEGEEATGGLTDYAQDQLSDIVYGELPEVDDTFEEGDVFATVESVKAASDVYMPVGGTIAEINDVLEESPELVNKDPFGEAWLVRIAIADQSELEALLDANAYKAFVESL